MPLNVSNKYVPSEVPPVPGRGLQAGSRFYIERQNMELRSQQLLRNAQAGRLFRIFAPRRSGKTSLCNRLTAYAQEQLSYQTVSLDFYQIDDSILQSAERLLGWFRETLSHELKLTSAADWDRKTARGPDCTSYLKSGVIAQLETPLVVIMDDADRLFAYPDVAVEFFSLVRAWSEPRTGEAEEVWQKLRQVIVYSTDVYIDFPINQSPFNRGKAIKPAAFDANQVHTLAQRYGGNRFANWDEAASDRLIQLSGGIPYLIQLAFYHIYTGEVSLEALLTQPEVMMEVYGEHLKWMLSNLTSHSALLSAFKEIVYQGSAGAKVSGVAPLLAMKLLGLGVVRQKGWSVEVSCELYRQYFGQVLAGA